jgi:uncharacterized protein (TIGR03083 family)
MLSADEVRRAVAREWDRFESTLRSLPGSDWDRPTILTGWSVRDLVAHTAWGTSMEADALRRWRTGEAGPAEGQPVDPAIPPQRLLAEQLASSGELRGQLAQLGDGDPARAVPMPYGEVPLDLVLQIVAMEAGIHAYDVTATCQGGQRLDADVVAATTVVLGAYLPILASAAPERPAEGTLVALRSPSIDLRLRLDGGAWALADGDGPAEVIAADDDSTLILFALGRVPAGAVHGCTSAAHRFKAWFPGP